MYNNLYMFENNLSKLNNIRLKEELKNIPITDCTADIAFVTTANGNIVFMKGEIPTDHTIDPIGYAQGLITPNMNEFAKNDVIAAGSEFLNTFLKKLPFCCFFWFSSNVNKNAGIPIIKALPKDT